MVLICGAEESLDPSGGSSLTIAPPSKLNACVYRSSRPPAIFSAFPPFGTSRMNHKNQEKAPPKHAPTDSYKSPFPSKYYELVLCKNISYREPDSREITLLLFKKYASKKPIRST